MAAERAPGWGTVALLALACAAPSIIQPALLIFVPFAVLLVAAPPLRPGRVAAGLLLLSAALLRGGAQQWMWFGGRGWVLLVAAWFLVAVLAWPGAAGFLPRALAAVAAATASAALVLDRVPGSWDRIDWTVRTSLWHGASDAAAVIGTRLADRPWAAQAMDMAYRLADLQALLFPALLALASLAGLAIAWFVFRRVALRERAPFAPLRRFRFGDDLVWVLIAGVALIAFPVGDAALRLGSNLVVFMGALYALRGLGVVLALAGTLGPMAILLATFAVLFLYPLVMAATVLVGVTDTWLDLRGRVPAERSGSGEMGP